MSSSSFTRVLTGDERAVRDVLDGLVAAWADNDADAFAGYYLPDATVVMPGGIFHRGRDEVRAFLAAGFAGRLAGSRSVDEPESVRLLGDAAVVVSRSGFLLSGESAVPADRMRRATWVLVKRDGGWRVAAFQNTPLTPA